MVGVALIPAVGPLSVLRALRILRALRLISAVPATRRVVSGLLAAAPGMASVASLLALVIFVVEMVIKITAFGRASSAIRGTGSPWW